MSDQEPQMLAQEPQMNTSASPTGSLPECEPQITGTPAVAGSHDAQPNDSEPTPSSSSALRAETARRNGAKSQGPATEEGKNRSRMNALKHGLRAEALLLHCASEDENAALEALREAVAQEFPVPTFEGHLLRESLVHALWQKVHCFNFEARELSQEMIFHGPVTDRLLRYGNAADKRLFRCLSELKRLQEHSTLAPNEEMNGGQEEQ